jgi:hypothetical protein
VVEFGEALRAACQQGSLTEQARGLAQKFFHDRG